MMSISNISTAYMLTKNKTTGAISLFYYPDEDDTGSVGNTFMPNTDVK